MKNLAIDFNTNSEKMLNALLYILRKKPGIELYNIMKVIFSAEKYHLNIYARPVYGDRYEAWEYGPVPVFLRQLLKVESNMPFYKSSTHGFVATAAPNMDMFSQTDIEALDHGIAEYAELSFQEVCDKSHAITAWKKYEKRVKAGIQHVAIDYDDLIESEQIREYLLDLGSLTLKMVL